MFGDNFSKKIESASSVKFAVVFIILIIFAVGSHNYFSPIQNCKRELDAKWTERFRQYPNLKSFDFKDNINRDSYISADWHCDWLSW